MSESAETAISRLARERNDALARIAALEAERDEWKEAADRIADLEAMLRLSEETGQAYEEDAGEQRGRIAALEAEVARLREALEGD